MELEYLQQIYRLSILYNSLIIRNSRPDGTPVSKIKQGSNKKNIIAVIKQPIMRNNRLYLKKRQQEFRHSFHINNIALPEYDPLKDRYLSGFFENPRVRANLIKAKLIKPRPTTSALQQQEFKLIRTSSTSARQQQYIKMPSTDNIRSSTRSSSKRRRIDCNNTARDGEWSPRKSLQQIHELRKSVFGQF